MLDTTRQDRREEMRHWTAEYLLDQYELYQSLQSLGVNDQVLLELITQEMDRRELEENDE